MLNYKILHVPLLRANFLSCEICIINTLIRLIILVSFFDVAEKKRPKFNQSDHWLVSMLLLTSFNVMFNLGNILIENRRGKKSSG